MRHRVQRSRREWEKIGASVQTLQWDQEGVSTPFTHNRPPPRFNQGVSLLDATPATRIRNPRVSAIRPSRRTRAFDMQRLRFQTFPSPKAGRQPSADNLRPPTTQQVLRAQATQDEDATRGKTPNPKGGLHLQLRPTRRVLRAGHQPSGPRLLRRKRTRTTL
jgi:hypothetical protein